jgi:hypothetical protein
MWIRRIRIRIRNNGKNKAKHCKYKYYLVGRGQSSRRRDMTAGPRGSHTGITFTKDFTSCKSRSNILILMRTEMPKRMIDAKSKPHVSYLSLETVFRIRQYFFRIRISNPDLRIRIRGGQVITDPTGSESRRLIIYGPTGSGTLLGTDILTTITLQSVKCMNWKNNLPATNHPPLPFIYTQLTRSGSCISKWSNPMTRF